MKVPRFRSLLWFVLVFALLWNAEAYGQTPRLSILSDLDGDHKSDLAVGRFDQSKVKIRIRLSSNGSRLSLTTNIENEPGLQLAAYDVDNDNDVDLVLTSIFSPRPIALWLNRANGLFEKADSWLAGMPARQDYPRYRRAHSHIDDEGVLVDSSPVLPGRGHFQLLLYVYPHATLEPAAIALRRHRSEISDRSPPLS